LVLCENAFDECIRLNVAADDVDAAVDAGTNQLGAGDPVADQPDDMRAPLEQQARRPRANQPRAAGHENAPVAPEIAARGHGLPPVVGEFTNLPSSPTSRRSAHVGPGWMEPDGLL